MKLYLISQSRNCSYDSYDSAVVIAANEDDARNTNPGFGPIKWGDRYNGWCARPEDVKVRYLGESCDDKPGVVCASYNAG